FGLMISTQALFGAPYAPDMDGGSSFQQIPEPPPDMVMPLRFAEPIPPTFTDLDKIPISPLTLEPIPEQEASSAGDNDSSD
ncbi:hypothetical protein A2U01_0053340, partial [Trifolium medium]|nr:hypothetical protein [Trifolium medium]